MNLIPVPVAGFRASAIDDSSNIEVDIVTCKNAVQGYTAMDYRTSKSYQKHLTGVQLFIKSNKKNKFLKEIVQDFFVYDYNKDPNWDIIRHRVGKSKIPIYLDFINRINPHSNLDRFKLFCLAYEDYYVMTRIRKSAFRSIVKELKAFVPDLSYAQLNNLLQGKKQKESMAWAESQYSFDFFIRSLGPNRDANKIIRHHFRFKDGPASIRQGGSDHKNKPYYSTLKDIIRKIKSLQVADNQ